MAFMNDLKNLTMVCLAGAGLVLTNLSPASAGEFGIEVSYTDLGLGDDYHYATGLLANEFGSASVTYDEGIGEARLFYQQGLEDTSFVEFGAFTTFDEAEAIWCIPGACIQTELETSGVDAAYGFYIAPEIFLKAGVHWSEADLSVNGLSILDQDGFGFLIGGGMEFDRWRYSISYRESIADSDIDGTSISVGFSF